MNASPCASTYEPPALLVIGSLTELTLSEQEGDLVDFFSCGTGADPELGPTCLSA